MQTVWRLVASLGLVLAVAVSAVAAQGLPGGATSLNETHGDWTVACIVPEGRVRCATTQTQVSGESRQRVFAIELTTAVNGTAGGVLVLPFGLRLEAGVVLWIDEHAPLPAGRFSTCLPAGCLVPLSLDAANVATLKDGMTLRVRAVANDTGQELVFPISLTGFRSAFERVSQLAEQ